MIKVENRWISYVILIVVYVIANAVGIVAYVFIPLPFWANLLIADVIATIVTFLFSLLFGNASVYDPYWSVEPMIIILGYFIFYEKTVVSILMLIAIEYWGLRLTSNWAYTFTGLTSEDWRYVMIKEKSKMLYPILNFLGIHLFPTLIVYACVLPAVFVTYYEKEWNAGSIVFFLVSICAATWQGIADIQMHMFRRNKTTTFIRVGLWRYSRHPNYLGEILMWWGVYFAMLCVSVSNWYLFVGALVNTLLFLCVSIPLADGRQKRKEGFEEYKKQTWMLLPFPKCF